MFIEGHIASIKKFDEVKALTKAMMLFK